MTPAVRVRNAQCPGFWIQTGIKEPERQVLEWLAESITAKT